MSLGSKNPVLLEDVVCFALTSSNQRRHKATKAEFLVIQTPDLERNNRARKAKEEDRRGREVSTRREEDERGKRPNVTTSPKTCRLTAIKLEQAPETASACSPSFWSRQARVDLCKSRYS